MSKAFTREDDEMPERPIRSRPSSPLPPGSKNYLTPDGAQRIKEELTRLKSERRVEPAAGDDSSPPVGSDRALEARIDQLEAALASAVVVPAPAEPHDQVRFGAVVTVRERAGTEARYRIVGVEEIDLDRGWISWLSPIAKALLNARLHQRVRIRLPAGEEELEITGIEYV